MADLSSDMAQEISLFEKNQLTLQNLQEQLAPILTSYFTFSGN